MYFKLLISFIVLVFLSISAVAQTPPEDSSKLLEKQIGSFSLVGSPTVKSGDSGALARGTYVSKGKQLEVDLFSFMQDADAYSRLTMEASIEKEKNPGLMIGSDIGTSSYATSGGVRFYKGRNFVRIESDGVDQQSLMEFARDLASKVDNGEGEIPALVKHLPYWENAQKTALFISHFDKQFPEYAAVAAIDSQRDADAVLADYQKAKLLIVEFHTPQLATDNDQRIVAKIHEQWAAGQTAPSAYRRVGNYSVFVFGAPDEQTAKQLIDQVKYEQVVQWLGENPYILKEAQRRYTETTLGVFVAVVKASGVALIGCFGSGALIGAWLFTRRRAQQRNVEAYSDAGGMLRLNLDEMTPQTNPARLLRERN